jgi:SAM-dependent methyltransferase
MVSCCRVCADTKKNGNYEAREMMYGLRTQFHYTECAACGSLSLMDPPADYATYYHTEYYSFAEPTRTNGFTNAIVARLRAKRDRSYFSEDGWLGQVLARHYENAALRATARLKIDRQSSILDVGCGTGPLVLRLHDLGFKNLGGVDPFISSDICYANGVQIRRCFLEDLKGESWDVVMFHHSLEHVPHPATTLRIVRELLPPRGQCLVRLPVVSWAWERYRASWVGLDPPRHFWLPTDKGMRILAESVGLRVTRAEYDSTGLQFWGSELYSRDHAYPEVGPGESKLGKFFTKRQLAEFRVSAEKLNREGRGDSAAFYLEKMPE